MDALRACDLWPEAKPSTPGWTGYRNNGRAPRRHATLDEVVLACAGGGKGAGAWHYKKADGSESFTVVRFDLRDGGKTFRPFHHDGRGWVCGDPPGKLPLFGFCELLESNGRVFVCEGERCVESARLIGLTATTSAHGCKAAKKGKTEWTPLAGREIVILPDNDGGGRAYAETIAKILRALLPPAAARIVELPGLPDGGDIVDWIESHDFVESEDLARRIEALADEAESIDVESASETVAPLRWRPFPVEVLPEPLQTSVRSGAQAIGCDPAHIALPGLAALASAIGTTRRIRLHRAWSEPSVIWAIVVDRSGTLKSPAMDYALRPFRRRQRIAIREYREAMERHGAAMLHYEYQLKEWKSKGRKLDRLVALRSAGKEPDPTLARWLEQLPSNLRERLSVRDLLDGQAVASAEPVSEHLRTYKQALPDGGASPRHPSRAAARATGTHCMPVLTGGRTGVQTGGNAAQTGSIGCSDVRHWGREKTPKTPWETAIFGELT